MCAGCRQLKLSAPDVTLSPIDLSYLNAKPARNNGFLRARNAMIFDGGDVGVKMFETNFGGTAAFSSVTIAENTVPHYERACATQISRHARCF